MNKEVLFFIVFLVAWIVVFGLFFEVSGASFDKSDYPTLPSGFFYIQTYRNSIGDIAAPQVEVWSEHAKKNPDSLRYCQAMIYAIWAIWILN
jgi:hypothetical protein